MKKPLGIGDIVKLIGAYQHPFNANGAVVDLRYKIGCVKTINHNGIGVEFFEPFDGGHNLGGAIDSARGWYVTEQSLLRLKPLKEVLKSMYRT